MGEWLPRNTSHGASGDKQVQSVSHVFFWIGRSEPKLITAKIRKRESAKKKKALVEVKRVEKEKALRDLKEKKKALLEEQREVEAKKKALLEKQKEVKSDKKGEQGGRQKGAKKDGKKGRKKVWVIKKETGTSLKKVAERDEIGSPEAEISMEEPPDAAQQTGALGRSLRGGGLDDQEEVLVNQSSSSQAEAHDAAEVDSRSDALHSEETNPLLKATKGRFAGRSILLPPDSSVAEADASAAEVDDDIDMDVDVPPLSLATGGAKNKSPFPIQKIRSAVGATGDVGAPAAAASSAAFASAPGSAADNGADNPRPDAPVLKIISGVKLPGAGDSTSSLTGGSGDIVRYVLLCETGQIVRAIRKDVKSKPAEPAEPEGQEDTDFEHEKNILKRFAAESKDEYASFVVSVLEFSGINVPKKGYWMEDAGEPLTAILRGRDWFWITAGSEKEECKSFWRQLLRAIE